MDGATGTSQHAPSEGATEQHPVLMTDGDLGDRLPQQQNDRQKEEEEEQRLDVELEGTLPGMGSKEQAAAIGVSSYGGQSEELFVPPPSPVPDVMDEGGAGRLVVGVAIQQSGKGALPVAMTMTKGSGSSSSSFPTAMGEGGSPSLVQLNGRGLDPPESGNKVPSSVPDRMAFALKEAAASVDDDDDVVAVPVRSTSGTAGM